MSRKQHRQSHSWWLSGIKTFPLTQRGPTKSQEGGIWEHWGEPGLSCLGVMLPPVVSVETRIPSCHPTQVVTRCPSPLGWCQRTLNGSWNLHHFPAVTRPPANSPTPSPPLHYQWRPVGSSNTAPLPPWGCRRRPSEEPDLHSHWQQQRGTPCLLHPASTMQYQRRPKLEGLGKF